MKHEKKYGAPKLQIELERQGVKYSVKLISRYMKRLKLRSITVRKIHPQTRSKVPNDKENKLNREFSTSNINQKWATDITYIRLKNNRWAYLCCVIDLHSKMIIGYSIKSRVTVNLTTEALMNAILTSTLSVEGIIIQTDLGTQFLSKEYEDLLIKYGIIHSYSRKGCPQDNSIIENFHSLLKREEIHHLDLTNFEAMSTN